MLRLLRSIGKKRFVQYYYQFRDKSVEAIIDLLIKDGVSNYNGARRRVIPAKKLFNIHLQEPAIKNIIESKRLSISVRNQAKQILNNL